MKIQFTKDDLEDCIGDAVYAQFDGYGILLTTGSHHLMSARADMNEHKCQMTMSDNGRSPTGVENYWQCGKTAKAWIPDTFKRTGWNGRQYLCGIHLHAYNKKNTKKLRPEPTMLTTHAA